MGSQRWRGARSGQLELDLRDKIEHSLVQLCEVSRLRVCSEV